jgi:outer membrane protein W
LLEDDVTNSLAFGGQIAYLWKEKVGGEFLASFAPSVGIANANLFLADNPRVSTYMANVIGSVPFGSEGQFRPYMSAGVGAIALHTDFFTSVSGIDTVSTNRSKFGSNIGGGLMVFVHHVGIRADVRHYNVHTSENDLLLIGDSPSDLTRGLLSGLEFWRADAGIAFRW